MKIFRYYKDRDMSSKYLSSRIVYSVFLYIMIMILIFINKPSIAFDKDGNIKSFGLAKKQNETIYSFGVLTVVISIVIFYIFCMFDLMF